jgi:hypothetical protein
MKNYNNYIVDSLNDSLNIIKINKVYSILDQYKDIAILIEKDENLVYVELDKNQNIFFILTALTKIKNIELLFNYNLEINRIDDDGYTPLILAGANYIGDDKEYFFELICLYTENGGNWNMKNHDNLSMLEYIRDKGNLWDNQQLFERIIEKYPEKYNSWIRWKKAQKFNL